MEYLANILKNWERLSKQEVDDSYIILEMQYIVHNHILFFMFNVATQLGPLLLRNTGPDLMQDYTHYSGTQQVKSITVESNIDTVKSNT